MSLLDKWNKKRFSVYDSEEKTVLEIIDGINNFNEEIIKEVDNKVTQGGNFIGSWQGIAFPTLSEEGLRGTVEVHSNKLEELEETKKKVDNIKKINVLDYGVKNDGLTDNTTLINSIISNGYKNLYFPKGTYLLSMNLVSNMTIEGDGINETILLQATDSNKNVINIIDGVSFINIKNLTIKGKEGNTKGKGIYIKGSTSDNYCNYISLDTVQIEETKESGYHCEGYSVENKLSNVFINKSGKNNFYNEGHDNLLVNCKFQRSQEENFINKGSNMNATNLHIIYGNILQKDLNKSSSDLKYSMLINGSRGSYNNIDCQDCFGHGVKILDSKDINLNNFLVDAIGINRDESEWWLANSPNNCIGIDIINSEVNANNTHVTNWHNNEQGSSFRIDINSKLKGNITRNTNNNIVKKEIVKTENIYNGIFEEKLFEGMKNVLNKCTINWGYTLNHSGTPLYHSGRYGNGVLLNSENNGKLSLDISTMMTNDDIEITFTYTPTETWDNTNTRWLLYGTLNNNILEILLTPDGKPFFKFYDNNNYYNTSYNEALTNGYSYRFFVKIKANKIIYSVYKYNILMGEYYHMLDNENTNNSTTGSSVLTFGNNPTPQTYWICNGVIEDIHISKCIPSDYDFKEIDTRTKVTPLTLFKANLNNSLL